MQSEAATHPEFQAKQLAIPAESALAIHTRSAQLQDKVEQQQLKRLVLDYEMREEAEELKGMVSMVFTIGERQTRLFSLGGA